MFWLLHAELGEPCSCCWNGHFSCQSWMGPFLLAQALQMLLACVFHSVPLNINDSPKEKGGGNPHHILEQICCSKKHEGQVGLMLLTLVRFTESASLLSYSHGH